MRLADAEAKVSNAKTASKTAAGEAATAGKAAKAAQAELSKALAKVGHSAS